MNLPRGLVGIVAGGLFAAAIVAPALGAVEQSRRVKPHVNAAARIVGTFTPAAADPRLAAMFARGGLDTSGLRFTPAETKESNRAVTVAVRARSNAGADRSRAAAAVEPGVGLAPVAYSLGAAVGWKRFALSGDMNKVDLAGMPGSREGADVAISYTNKRFFGRIKATSDRPVAALPLAIEDMPSYSLDLGGSYALTRHIDVTAGVRYRSDRERLARIDDNRRDSQAVYLGTAFRF